MRNELNLESVFNLIFENILRGLTDFAPRILLATVIVLTGLVVAKVIQKVLQVILVRVKLDLLFQRTGIEQSLKRFGVHDKPSIRFPRIIFFVTLIFIFRIAAQAIGMIEVADAINAALSFFPKIVAALLIFLVGSIIGQIAGKTVESSAGESGIEYARILGKLVYSLVLFIVAVMAVSQLKLNMEIVNSVILIILAGFCLAIALSLGLGTRELTRNIIIGFYVRKIFASGDVIEINGERGIVKSVTPLVTLIERDNQIITVSNSIFLNSEGKK